MRRIAIPAIVLALAWLAIGGVLTEKENTLVTRSRRLVTNHDWLEYAWLDNDHILYRIYHRKRQFRVLDVGGRTDRPVEVGDPKLAAAQNLMGGMIPRPDGRSFITFVAYGSNDAVWIPVIPAASERPKRLKAWPKGQFVGWLEAGKSFLMDTTNTPRAHEGEGPESYQRYQWPDLRQIGSLTRVEPLPSKEGEAGWWTFAFDAGGVQLASRWSKPVAIAHIDPTTGKADIRQIELPVKRNLEDVARSPDGKRILWVLNKNPGNTLAEMRFWLSDDKGGGFAEVGHTGETPKLDPNQWVSWPQMVKWRPDGTAVTFVYEDGLFLMPLPR